MASPDEILLAAVAQSDTGAFETLYDRFASRLLGLIIRVLGSRDDAEDVLQEVFREVWAKANRYDPKLGSPAGWLIMVARARAIDHLRKRGSEAARRSAMAGLAASGTNPGATSAGSKAGTGSGEVGDEGWAASRREGLDSLPDDQREAVALAFYRGMTAQQIADLHDLPLGTVKTRIRLGVKKLREYMNPQQQGTT